MEVFGEIWRLWYETGTFSAVQSNSSQYNSTGFVESFFNSENSKVDQSDNHSTGSSFKFMPVFSWGVSSAAFGVWKLYIGVYAPMIGWIKSRFSLLLVEFQVFGSLCGNWHLKLEMMPDEVSSLRNDRITRRPEPSFTSRWTVVYTKSVHFW